MLNILDISNIIKMRAAFVENSKATLKKNKKQKNHNNNQGYSNFK